MWASISSGTVTAVSATPPAVLPAPTRTLAWVNLPYDVSVGFVWGGSAFVAPPVPQSISSFQAKAAMLLTPGKVPPATLLDDVTAAVAAAVATNPLAQLAFNEATTWNRTGSLVVGLSASLGLTAAQVDALFVMAAAIVV